MTLTLAKLLPYWGRAPDILLDKATADSRYGSASDAENIWLPVNQRVRLGDGGIAQRGAL